MMIESIRHDVRTLPHFNVLAHDLTNIEADAAHFKAFKTVLVFGIGGSSLGGQALCAISQSETTRLVFVDNVDGYHFKHTISGCQPHETGVLAISKSGNTVETLMQLMSLEQIWPDFNWAKQALCITEPQESALSIWADDKKIPKREHPTDIGGRFSVFSIVGLLPALIAGVDVNLLRQGAREMCRSFLEDDQAAQEFAQHVQTQYDLFTKGVHNTVFFVYSERLRLFAAWFAQLWAESLGKKDAAGKSVGFTPITAVGTVDQHSQLQLYLDGPKDKYITFFTLKSHEALPAVSSTISHPILEALTGHTMDDLMQAEQKATLDTLVAAGCPVRHIEMEKLTAFEMGHLMMHFIIQTLMMGKLMDINVFDQPAVESGKKLALENLSAFERQQ